MGKIKCPKCKRNVNYLFSKKLCYDCYEKLEKEYELEKKLKEQII